MGQRKNRWFKTDDNVRESSVCFHEKRERLGAYEQHDDKDDFRSKSRNVNLERWARDVWAIAQSSLVPQ